MSSSSDNEEYPELSEFGAGFDEPATADLPAVKSAKTGGFRCRLGLHTAIPSKLWNDGHYFSACSRCGVPMVRTPAENWHPVPSHYRIVWRKRTEDDVVWPTHLV